MREAAGLTRRMFTALASASVLTGFMRGGLTTFNPNLQLQDSSILTLDDGSTLVLG